MEKILEAKNINKIFIATPGNSTNLSHTKSFTSKFAPKISEKSFGKKKQKRP